jgi:small subunit ribosomal protein S6
MVILEAGLDEDAIRGIIDRATQLITAGGGTSVRVDRWGKRRFAYEVRHRNEGFYVIIETTAEPSVMADLDRMLVLTDDVIRHKVIRLPESTAGRKRPASSAETGTPAAANANGA